MKWMIAVPLLALSLVGCQEGSTGAALSTDECTRLHDRTNEIAKQGLGVDVDAVEGGAEQRQRVIDACAAGETYTREDFDCVAKATTMEEMNACNLTRHM